MTLLSKAKATENRRQYTKSKPRWPRHELKELALAWATGEIGSSQAARALGYKWSNGNSYCHLAIGLREVINDKPTIYEKDHYQAVRDAIAEARVSLSYTRLAEAITAGLYDWSTQQVEAMFTLLTALAEQTGEPVRIDRLTDLKPNHE